MYADNGLMFPYCRQSFPQEALQVEDSYYSQSQRPNASLTTSSDYDLGAEGDLFKAPEPIFIEEPLVNLDPMAAAISLISLGDDVTSHQGFEISNIIESSFENGQLLSEIFYECKRDLLARDEAIIAETKLQASEVHLDSQGSSLQESVSSESLNTMNWPQGAPLRPTFLDFQGAAAYGNGRMMMRRSLSEGDMKYACRKALADSQPRIRGRFAKTEEVYGSKREALTVQLYE
nr:zinc finger protein CONSTANS-LIKE 10-like isoform X1 [Ipomoea batatas]